MNMIAQLRYSVPFLLAILLHQCTAQRQKLKERQRTSSIPMRIHTRKQCFNMRREENLIQTFRGQPLCTYKGRNYTMMEHIFDEVTCRACVCHAPHRIFCCQAELVPVDMPFRCAVDPAGRLSRVHRLGKCMAPLITKGTAGKYARPCKDRQLAQHLRSSTLRLPQNTFSKSRKIWADANHKNNYRRHAGMKEEMIYYKLLRDILDTKIYEVPIYEQKK